MKSVWPPSAAIFLLPTMKLGQGNILSSVCQEFCSRGGDLGRYPRAGTPLRQVHPRQVHPLGRFTPGRYNPWAGNLPGRYTPPIAVHAGRYGQQAGGTHPTGMQSCL